MAATYTCSIELDASSQLISNCSLGGNPVTHPIRVDPGDNFLWYANAKIDSFTVGYYAGATKDTPCTIDPFKRKQSDTRHHSGFEITTKCGKTVSYEVNATLTDGTNVSLDPIIIVGKLSKADIVTIALVGIGLVVAFIFYSLGRAKERRMRASGAHTPS